MLEGVDQEAIGIERPGLHAAAPGELPQNETFGDVLSRGMARRSFLMGAAATVPVLMAGVGVSLLPSEAEAAARDGLAFKPIQPSTLDEIVVPRNYVHDIVVKWGDPLSAGAPAFTPNNQTAAAQRKQFGYNCDFVGYFKLEGDNRALLCVNHEYTTGGDMFKDYVPGARQRNRRTSKSPRMAARWSRSFAARTAGAMSGTRNTIAALPAIRRCSSPGRPPATR